MRIIIHRVNTLAALDTLPQDYGIEIDVRHNNQTNTLYLNHDPGTGENLETYLKQVGNRFVIFNIKEAGIEQMCIDLAHKYEVKDYFLLDVEFPFLYKASRNGFQNIAVRYSEVEPIEMTLAQKGFVKWVWIDVNTTLPLNPKVIEQLESFQTCLVSPECWARPEDIANYQARMLELNFQPTAVMTDLEYAKKWK